MGFYDDYRNNADKRSLEKLAFEYLVTDTLDKNLKGPSKSKQVTGMDMESLAKTIYPTMIYTFKYNSEHLDKEGKYEFRDYVPVIFCMNIDKDYIYGINFNLLPNDVRGRLLDVIAKSNPRFYTYGIYNEGLQLSDALMANLVDETKRKELLRVFDGLCGVPVSKAYRRYKKAFIENPRLIEYDVWSYIPYLVFTDSIRGANLAVIQKSMIDSNK